MKQWLLRHFAKKDKHLELFLRQRDCVHTWQKTSDHIYKDYSLQVRDYQLIARTARCTSCQYFLLIQNWTQLPARGFISVEHWNILK